MPTYEYECKSCNHTFEAFQSMSEPSLKVCPQCGKEIRRIINGGSGIIFKGSGFYVTDKKGGGGSSPGPAKTPEKPAGDGKAASADTTSSPKGDAGGSFKENSSGLEKKAAG